MRILAHLSVFLLLPLAAGAEPYCDSPAASTRRQQLEAFRQSREDMEKILAKVKNDAKVEDCSSHYGIARLTGSLLNKDRRAAAAHALNKFHRSEEIPSTDFYGPGLCFMDYRNPSHTEEEALAQLFEIGGPAQQTFLAKKDALVILKRTHFPNAPAICEPKLRAELEEMKRFAGRAGSLGFKGWIDRHGRYQQRIPHGQAFSLAQFPDHWTPRWTRVRRDPESGDLMVVQITETRIAFCGFPASAFSSTKEAD